MGETQYNPNQDYILVISKKRGVKQEVRDNYQEEQAGLEDKTNYDKVRSAVYKMDGKNIEKWVELADKYPQYINYNVFPVGGNNWQNSAQERRKLQIETGNGKKKKDITEQPIEDLIPEDVDEYIPRNLVNGNDDLDTLKTAFKARPEGHPQNVLLKGPTGTGKTHLCKKVAEELELPMVRVNMNEMTTVEDFVGQFVPSEDGGFEWKDGVMVRLMKEGGLLVIDEINACPPEILFVLHSVLDFREITLTQKDGEVIEADEDFWVVGAMNPDYHGTKKLNEALNDRFRVQFEMDYDKRVERRIIEDENLRELAKKLRKMHKSATEEIRTPVSTRMLKQFEQNREIYGYKLAKQMFVNKFKSEEQKAVEEVVEMHLGGDN